MDLDKIDLQKARRYIKRYRQKYKLKNVYGFDVETINGKPYSLQIYGENVEIFKIIWGMKNKEILDYLYSICKKGIVYAHNLSFDFGVSFPEILRKEEKKFTYYNYNSFVIYPHPCYATFSKNKQGSIIFADSLPFFPMSLEKASKFIGMKQTKMKRPEYLGKRKPKKSEMEYFKKYAMLDAKIVYKLGLEILDLHKEFDVSLAYSVSIASLGAKIYRKFFLSETLELADDNVLEMALLAYHGGRAEAFGFGHAKDIRVIDINSSYPYSMSEMKIPIENKWKFSKKITDYGFYEISGFIPKMKISPLPYDKNGLLQFPCGKFTRLVVTGFEARRIMQVAHDFKVHRGYKYVGRFDMSMRDFCDYFYEKKREAKKNGDKVKYHFYKILMNSLYGKTIQLNSEKITRREVGYKCGEGYTIEENRKIPAGMFNPVIASWITAHARCNLYDEMKKYEPYVLYCDTDSIFLSRNAPAIEYSKELGKFDFEKAGHFYLFREKFYILMRGEEIVKSGRHSFHGKNDLLLTCFDQQKKKYVIKRMVQFREAKRQHKKAFVFEDKTFNVNFVPSEKRIIKNLDFSRFKKCWYWNKPFFIR